MFITVMFSMGLVLVTSSLWSIIACKRKCGVYEDGLVKEDDEQELYLYVKFSQG